jgi:hypothetical protein
MYELAATRLKRGIQVVKYNYTNMKRKKIWLWLSQDEKYLEYEPVEKKFKDFFKMRPKIAMSDFTNLLYGGVTSTFKRH